MVSGETDVCWVVRVGGLDCHFDGKTRAHEYGEALLANGYDDVAVVRCDECNVTEVTPHDLTDPSGVCHNVHNNNAESFGRNKGEQ